MVPKPNLKKIFKYSTLLITNIDFGFKKNIQKKYSNIHSYISNIIYVIIGKEKRKMPEKDCQHEWKYVKDWEGDPSVPNGTRDCSYWTCTKCDEISDDVPEGYEDDFYGPEVDLHDYYDDKNGSVDFVYDPFRQEPS